MSLYHSKIIIFKSGRVGDLIYFSPSFKIIRENISNPHITLVCSENNYRVAKNYGFIDKFIILEKGSFFKGVLLNFKSLFLTKYKYLFQFDGKNKSYMISYLIRAKIKSAICFIKYKKFLKLNYKISRPSKMLLYLFFQTRIFGELLFFILSKLNFPVWSFIDLPAAGEKI